MTLNHKLILGAGLIVLGGMIWMIGMSPVEDPHAGHSHDTEVAYYTCPMHPSVKLHDPDAPCPICGMDLAAVPKTAPVSVEGQPEFVTLSTAQQQMIGLTTATITAKDVSSDLKTRGIVTFDESRLTDVNLKVSGWIQELYVDSEGKRVTKGEPLFTLYSPELVTSEDEYLLAFEGLRRLVNEGDVAEEVVVWHKRLLSSARERLQLWDLSPSQIQMLESTGKRQSAVTIFAPVSGIVVDRMAVAGMHVKPSMRLYRIAQLDTVWVQADIYEHDLASVSEGQEASVVTSFHNIRFRGRVDYIYPYLNPDSRTATARILIPNPEGHLKPDMFADVTLHGDQEALLIVPESAVLFSGEMRMVFVAQGDGRFSRREVILGRRFSEGYQVRSGVEGGERVVTSASFLLDSESKLKNVGMGM